MSNCFTTSCQTTWPNEIHKPRDTCNPKHPLPAKPLSDFDPPPAQRYNFLSPKIRLAFSPFFSSDEKKNQRPLLYFSPLSTLVYNSLHFSMEGHGGIDA